MDVPLFLICETMGVPSGAVYKLGVANTAALAGSVASTVAYVASNAWLGCSEAAEESVGFEEPCGDTVSSVSGPSPLHGPLNRISLMGC